MAYADNFENDIFISYAWDDNQPLLGEETGWVDHFVIDLKSVLRQAIGEDSITMFRDVQQTPNTRFDKEIPEQMKKSALFLALISPNFLESEWCMSEIENYFSHMQNSGRGTEVGGHKSRLFTILLTDLPYEKWPGPLKNTNPFRFFKGQKEESDPLHWKESAYYYEINKLKRAIKATLDAHNSACKTQFQEESITGTGGFTLFLAEVAEKLQYERKQLQKTLTTSGITLLEKIPPPHDWSDHNTKLNKIIQKAGLAVHLIGDVPGREFDDKEEVYYPVSQVDFIHDKHVPQLILLPETLESTKGIRRERYKTWLDNLKTSCLKAEKTWLAYFTGENLCSLVKEKIEELQEKADEGLFLICTDTRDKSCAYDLASWLLKEEKQEAEVITPGLKSGASSLIGNTKPDSAVKNIIVLYGNSSMTWVSANLEQYKKRIVSGKQGIQLWLYLFPERKESLPIDFTAFITENNIRILDNSQSSMIDPAIAKKLITTPGKEKA